jgi:hypothetical protein
MPTVDGGIIQSSVPLWGESRRVAVQGVWTGGVWHPSTKTILRQYRGTTLVGVWRIVGVDIPSRQYSDAVLLLEPEGNILPPQQDDIAVFGDGTFSRLPIRESEVTLSSATPVEFSTEKYHGIAVVKDRRIDYILLLHKQDSLIENRPDQIIFYDNKPYTVKIGLPHFSGEVDYLIQVSLNGKIISTSRLINTLNPLRSFMLDSGQELLFQVQSTPHRRRLAKTYSLFEPSVTATAGSLKLLIHPCRPFQLPLYITPDEPLRLFIQILRTAAYGSMDAIAQPLLERVFSVDKLLKQVRQFIHGAGRGGEFTISATDLREEITFGQQIAEVIHDSIQTLETRELERKGLLYGVDLIRGWCRILTETDGEKEDWTLHFEKQWRETIKGEIPREVIVEFLTQARPGMKRGTGKLLSIQNTEETTKAFPKTSVQSPAHTSPE